MSSNNTSNLQDNQRAEWTERSKMKVLNTDLVRVDAADKVTGRAKYTHDMRLPGMVWARIITCPYPSAEISIDTTSLDAMAGVLDARGLLQGDSRTEGTTLYVGQPIAVVTAETPELAEDAARALSIEMEELDFAVTLDQAEEDFAVSVRSDGNVRTNRSRGDADKAQAALNDAAIMVEATYSLPVQHHVCLETHGVVADVRGQEATVYASNQAVNFVAMQVAGQLKWQQSQVKAVVEHMGGGFGSKFQIGVEGSTACELSKDLQRPVHLMLTRDQEFTMGGNRSGNQQTLALGASKDGRLVGMTAKITRNGGLGGGSYPGQPYIYSVAEDAYHMEDRSVYTQTDSNRAMRAPGHPQASFGIESVLDEVAYGLKLDPLEVRKLNLESPVYHRQLDRAAQEIGWTDHPNKTDYDRSTSWKKRGIGFAVATWGGGGRPGCGCQVRIGRDGSIEVGIAVQDLGTGVRTAVGAIVAEEFARTSSTPGRLAEEVRVRIGDSNLPPGVGSGGSVTTGSMAPSVKEAAHKARLAFLERMQAAGGGEGLSLGSEGVLASDGSLWKTWPQACSELGTDGLTAMSEPRGRSTWSELSYLQGTGVHGAQAALVEVDVLTGHVDVLRMVNVQDCGIPLNRMALRSQMNGGQIQALSYAMHEERIIDPDLGLMLSNNLEDYKIAGSLEINDIVSLIDDEDDRQVPIGIAEASVIPGHSAIANAIYNACGVRLRDLPFTPDKLLNGLAQLG